MITILAIAALTFSAFCTLLLVCACIVGGRADEQEPRPPVRESWEQSRARFERQHGKRMRKYFA